jgi:hypothetical protein
MNIRERWLLVLLLAISTPISAAQCLYPRWHAQAYGMNFVSTISAIDVAERAIFPGIDPATHPGIYGIQPATCTLGGGSEQEGTAGYVCSKSYMCGPPTCNGHQSSTTQISVWQSCDAPFWITAAPPQDTEVSTSNCVGDPINPSLANVYKSETDYSLESRGSSLKFGRTYTFTTRSAS